LLYKGFIDKLTRNLQTCIVQEAFRYFSISSVNTAEDMELI